MPLHELLQILEDDEVLSADNFVSPPQDGENTDSDSSDDEHEGNINHLGPTMLRTEAELVIHAGQLSNNCDLA